MYSVNTGYVIVVLFCLVFTGVHANTYQESILMEYTEYVTYVCGMVFVAWYATTRKGGTLSRG